MPKMEKTSYEFTSPFSPTTILGTGFMEIRTYITELIKYLITLVECCRITSVTNPTPGSAVRRKASNYYTFSFCK